MSNLMNEEIKDLIKKVAICIERDAKFCADNDVSNTFKKLFDAYNSYQEDECNGEDYIHNINNPDDLICCIKGGLGRNELQGLLNECSEKNCDYFLFGENYPTAQIITNIRDAIANNALELATCVVTYPYCETYRALYTLYITDAILNECDTRYTNIREYVD